MASSGAVRVRTRQARTAAPDAAYCAYVQSILDGIAAAGTGWDSNATYRVGVTSRNITAARFNAIGYVTGNGVPATDPNPVMTKASCSGCHGERVVLNVHGNQRHEPELCSSCHNDFTFDADNSQAAVGGWANISAVRMVHKIHAGIDGYRVATNDYSDVRFPDWLFGRGKGPQNCSSCHKDDGPVANAKWNAGQQRGLPDLSRGRHTERRWLQPAAWQLRGCAGQLLRQLSRRQPWPVQAPSADQFHGVTSALATLDERNDYRLRIVGVSDAAAGQPAEIAWQVVNRR
jgi:hypothetical protein